jgi:putative transposase
LGQVFLIDSRMHSFYTAFLAKMHHPEGNSYIERFHRNLKEEEVWTAECRNLEEAWASIARWIREYNYERPHGGVGNRTPREAYVSCDSDLNKQALTV